MSPLTRSFLLFLIALKQKDEQLIANAAKLVEKRFLDDPADATDRVDNVIRKIVAKTDADDAYAFLAELLPP